MPPMKDCVRGWVENPQVEGVHKMQPVFCSSRIEYLEKTVSALVGLVKSAHLSHLSSTDSEIIEAARKLADKKDRRKSRRTRQDKPQETCDTFYLIPRVRTDHKGHEYITDQTVKCAEPVGHKGFCISKEGWIRPKRVES